MGGSFAHSGWDQDSDVDFSVVIQRDLTPIELKNLKVLHAKIYMIDAYRPKHLGGSFLPKDVLGDLSRVNQPLWHLDNGSLDSCWHRLVDDALAARENQYEKVFLPSDAEVVNQTKDLIRHILKSIQ